MKHCPKCGNNFSDEANFCPTDATRLEAMASVPAADDGLLGGRFRLGERIGGGRTGDVYRADDGGRPCAVKLIYAAVFPSPLLAQRAERELKHLEQLESAHVARVLGHGNRGDQLWVATELSGGGSLEQILATQGPQPVGRAAEITLAIGHGLADAARIGVVHRDLSPKNVLIDGAGVKLINFGVPVPTTPEVQGVAEYVSPEQIEGKPVDQRCNIYSLGAIFYALVTGRPPFVGDPRGVHTQHLTGIVPTPSTLAPVGPEIDAIVLRALERQPARRYMTLRQFLEELEKLAASSDASGTQPMGRVAGVDAGGIGSGAGKTKKKALAQTMMGGFQAVDGPAATAQGMPPSPGLPAPASLGPAVAGHPALSAAPAPLVSPPSGPHPSPPQPAAPSVAAPAPNPYPPSPLASAPTEPVAAAPLAAAPAPPAMTNPGMRKGNGQQPASGKGKGRSNTGKKQATKGKFRETMWFKKGELDAAAAAEAAAKQKTGDAPASDKADEMPIEDRYGDDGSLSSEDQGKYSLRTGHTQAMAAMRDDAVPRRSGRSAGVSEEDLISEMKKGRGIFILLILIGLAALVGVVVFFATR